MYNINMYYEQVGRILSAFSQAPIFVAWIFFLAALLRVATGYKTAALPYCLSSV